MSNTSELGIPGSADDPKAPLHDLLSATAHELRTPLAVIAGYVELLLSLRIGSLNARQIAVLEEVKASSDRLKRLADDYLNVGMLERGNISLRLEQNDMRTCLDGVCSVWAPAFSRKRVSLRVEQSSAIPPFRFDTAIVERVISNLLDNALKFTPAGGTVLLTLAKHRSPIGGAERNPESSQRAVCITVSDTACGIAPEYQQEIFKDFFRVPGSHDAAGTGLGLSIVRKLLEAHGGKIWVESEPERGSKFSVLIPIPDAHESP